MRFHTNFHTAETIQAAIDQVNNGPRPKGWVPIILEVCTEHGSRTHERAFEVRLSGNGTLTNSGNRGAGDFKGATWDEWGAVIGALYGANDGATRDAWGPGGRVYANRADFHHATQAFYVHGVIPADAHARHKWENDGWGYFPCMRCTRVRVGSGNGFTAASVMGSN